MISTSMSTSALPSIQMIQNHNQLISVVNEIKKFKNYSKQLNLLLNETLNSFRELKSNQNQILENNNDLTPLSDIDIDFIKSLKSKRLTFIICGQNVLVKAILTNELLTRQLLPFQIDNLLNEKWRIIKIKYGRSPNYTFQLIDSDFELMSFNQTNTNNDYINGILSSKNINNNNNNGNVYSTMPFPITASSLFRISTDDLRINVDNNINEDNTYNNAENQAIIEISIDCKLLEYDCDIIVYSNTMQKSIYEKLSQNIIPIYLYGIIGNQLSQQDIEELNNLKEIFNNNSIFFVKIPTIDNYKHINSSSSSSLLATQTPTTNEYNKFIESIQSNHQININLLKYLQQQSINQTNQLINNNLTIFKSLCDLKFLNIKPTNVIQTNNNNNNNSTTEISLSTSNNDLDSVISFMEQQYHDNEFCEKWHLFFYYFSVHLKRQLRYLCIQATTILYRFHEKCLNSFINYAYDMARDMLVTPKKLEYAREKEQVLYDSLNSLASMKQEELKTLINNTINTNRESIINAARQYQFNDVEFIDDNENDNFTSSFPSNNNNNNNNNNNDNKSNDDVLGLSRSNSITVKYVKDFKKCTQQIQELVITKLNNAIARQIIDSVEVLKENYIGTLKRCLQSLEDMNGSSSSNNSSDDSLNKSESLSSTNSKTLSLDISSASEALKQILHSAYQVEVTLTGSSNIIRVLIERMKELLRNMPWNTTPKLDEEWKVAVASNMLNSLSESKLAKILCNQMRERLKSSHYLFTTSLKVLETKHTGRLEKTEESQTIIRKVLAPKFAKLSLESTSLKDLILYGMPQLGREMGRGQYGVVYQCTKWAKYTNCAIKSVVPPDEKHWNDLALEFHYTKQITDHERIVKLIGSVIDYSYGGGNSPAVLLIMEGMKRDLYTALKTGLDWLVRLQISLDVVEGIRYLHGRGLVHRDIKLKNVLLDVNNRAKITDLGFCKPEAMMSGSVVGTPVHMAPEVFNSKYDNSVDIYAFGILFWYICAGNVRLPQNFEQCQCKDDLWSAVKRGKRPERLNTFDDDCWKLMECCWSHDPKERPHIGEVFTYLSKIFIKYKC